MNSTRSIARLPAFWLMVGLAGITALLGAWLIISRLPAMEAGLDDQTATPSLVYGGQSWVVVGAALLAAGILGLVAALGVAVLRSPAAEAVEPVAEGADSADSADAASDDDLAVLTETDAERIDTAEPLRS